MPGEGDVTALSLYAGELRILLSSLFLREEAVGKHFLAFSW
jgi:hypothetical protein